MRSCHPRGRGCRQVRPARYTCSGPSASGLLDRGGREGGCRSAELVEGVAQRLVAEHRALEAGGTDLDAEQVQQVVGSEGLDVGERLALDLVGQEAGAGLADRAATTGEPDTFHDAITDADLEGDPVAAQRVAALEARA